MSIVLPPSHVGANSSYFSHFGLNPSNATDLMAHSPGFWLLMQQEADENFRLDRYKAGDWVSAFNCALLWGEAAGLEELRNARKADSYIAKGMVSGADEAMRMAISKPFGSVIGTDNELTGGVLSPLSALAHFVEGTGRPMWMNINNLGMRLELGKFSDLKAAMHSAPQGITGYSIDTQRYDTIADSLIVGGVLGTITLRVEGEINKVGGFTAFAGVVRAYEDTYDANLGTFRSDSAEFSTRVLKKIEQVTTAAEYQIQIIGQLPLHFELH